MILVLPGWELAEAGGLHEPTSPASCMRGSTRGVRKLSLNCLFAGRNNNNFDLCRPPGN